MENTKEEIWYCENSKGQKIPPYKSNYDAPKQSWINKNRHNLYFILLFILFWGGLITLFILAEK